MSGEPCFPHLLLATCLIEIDNQIRIFGLKSAGGSLNAMCPFSPMPRNAISTGDDANCLPTSRTTAAGSAASPWQQVIMPDASFLDQLLHEHLAKAAWMRDGQADVFIEMEGLNLAPVDIGSFCKRIEKLELRRCGGRDDASLAAVSDGAANGVGGLLGGGTA